MYELLVLALLMHGPCHGYLITKFANEMIGPWAKISPGTLYPLLIRLEQSELIEALPSQEVSHSQRQAHHYAITPAGRRRFHTLMMDISSNPGTYPRIFHLKAVHFQFLSPREYLYLVDHYINYCERIILHLQSEARDMLRVQPEAEQTKPGAGHTSTFTDAVVEMLQHLAKQEQGELAWARQVRERAVAALGAETQTQAEPEEHLR